MAEFSFSGFMEDLGKQRQVAEQRRQVEVQTQKEQADIRSRSAKAAADYDASVEPLRKSIVESQAKKQHARQLADSGKPTDLLRLMGLQATDPGGYSRKVRQARLAEDVATTAALGQAHNVSQTALEAELLASGNRLEAAKLQEAIGLERFKQLQEEAALFRESLDASITMQNGAIHGMTEEELEAAAANAKVTKSPTVNISGVDVETDILADRIDALKERKHQRLVRANLRTLQEDEFANVNEVIANREHERRLNKDERDRLPHTLAMRGFEERGQKEQMANEESDKKIRQGQRQLDEDATSPKAVQSEKDRRSFVRYQQQKEIIDESQKRELDTMDENELLDLRKNGYVSEGGEVFNRDSVDTAYTRRLQVRQDTVNRRLESHALSGFDRAALTAESSRTDIIAGRFRENSPGAQAVRSYKAALGLLSGQLESPDIAERLAGYQAYQTTRENFDKVIVAQAKAESNGDKIKEEILTEFYRGNPIPQATLRNGLTERLQKNKSTSDLLPPEVAVKVERRFREIQQRQIQENIGIGLDKDQKDALKVEAAQMAIEGGINESLVNRNEEILSNQVQSPSHPLFGWTPAKMVGYMKSSDERARADWIKRNDLTPEEVQAVMELRPIPNREVKDLLAELKHSENVELLTTLNGLEQDLGTKVAKWWEIEGDNYLRIEQSAHDSKLGTQGFEQSTFRALARQQEATSMFEYGVTLVQSDESTRNEEAQRRADYLAFGGRQEYGQVTLLQMNKDLQDDEKRLIMDKVISPLLVEAGQRGLTFKEQGVFIERSIMNMQPEDKELARVLKVLKRNRSQDVQTLSQIQSMWSIAEQYGGRNPMREKGMEIDPAKAGIGWYDEYRNAQPQVPTTP